MSRADEQRLEKLVNDIEKKINQKVFESVDPMHGSMVSIVRAVHRKADRVEMEKLVAER
jgi:3-deoxy-D-arabino-heptulosonate 7-phosphate (DAHP) synthase class II